MKKVKILKLLRVIFYVVGFPLLLLLTAIGTMPFFGEPIFNDSCAYGIFAVLIMWAVVEIVRLIMKLTCKNNQLLQTIVVSVVALIIMIVPVVLLDELVGPKIDAVATIGEDYKLAYIVGEDNKATVVSADTAGAVIISSDFANLQYTLTNGSRLETYNYQIGRYKPITNKTRVDKALYRMFLDKGDDFMNFYGINKWYNFEDFYFDNYTGIDGAGKPTEDGYLPGVATRLDREIELLQNTVVEYHRAYVANGNSEAGLDTAMPATYAKFLVAMGEETSTEHWSLTELYKFKAEFGTKTYIYPLFVARNYVYIFIGIVVLSTIVTGYCNDKIKALALGKED
ncbi:MAG TPA: hypothetical protein VJZ69_04670 [Clostridia bacterium]|nr:hypothetical protein [Clostridia bacterium]